MTTVRGRSTLKALAAAFRACGLYALFLLVAAPALAGSVNLAWDPPTGPAPAGYMVYYGPSAGTYPSKIDVGNATTYTVTGLVEGTTYHFAATDYDASRAESGFSNDVAATVPVTTPVASFTAGTTSGTAPLTVSFTNSSTGSITSYSWNFGDGTSSTVASPSHVYSAAGVYTVSLTVSGSSGSNTQTRTNYITVTAPTPAPVAQFTGSPVSGTSPLNVNFTNASTGSITSYAWSFGDGTSSTVASPSHVYSAAGVYTVSLTATGPGGSNTQTRTSYVTVTAPTPAPVASFIGSPTSGVAPVTVSFTNQSVGSITGSAWDFGDGTTSTAVNPVHVYSAAGTYTVKLTVTGPGGSNTQTRTSYVTVTAPTPAPVASFIGSPTSGVAPVTVSFTNQSVGSITGSAWDFGDGTTSTAVNPVHVYSAAGTYTVKLTVTGPGGSNTQTRTSYVTVTAPTPAPVASFIGSPTSGVAPVTVSFTNQSVGSITGSAWDFGDGTTSTAVNPVHVYSAAGTYTVKLTVTGPGGSNTQTRTSYVTVTAPTPAPVAQFTGTPVSGTSPLTVNFSNASTGSITGYCMELRRRHVEHGCQPQSRVFVGGFLHREPHGHGSGRKQHANARQLRDGDVADAGASGAVHRYACFRHVTADGEFQQRLDGQHHGLLMELRRWHVEHGCQPEPRVFVGGLLHREPDRHRSGRKQHADDRQLRDGDRRIVDETRGPVQRSQCRRPYVR